ncbi:MAG: hypothetical protein RJS98_11055 [Rhodospirillaceae bacterium]
MFFLNQRSSGIATVADARINHPTFAINFIAQPDGAFRQSLAQTQQALAADMPSGVFACPLDSLHLTVVPLIWARGTYAFDVRQWWSDHLVASVDFLANLTGTSSVWTMICAGLEVYPSAIVLRFAPSPELIALRQQIYNSDKFEAVILEKPDFFHITLFRFEAAMPVSGIAGIVDRHTQMPPNWTIDQLQLCQEDVYPSLQTKQIASFQLAR